MPIRIRSLTTTAGYLQNASVSFADGLTCVIGARGTCKSTVVESIRFAFDCNADRVVVLVAKPDTSLDAEAGPAQGLIRATLGSGTARCTVAQDIPAGQATLTVEREVDSPARVYREGIKELADLSILHCVEIYSQGDLQRIAERDDLRLELIDRPNKTAIAMLRDERAQGVQKLKQLGDKIRSTRAEAETLRIEVNGLDPLQAQLSELRASRPSLSRELDVEREGYLRRKSLLDRLQKALDHREHLLKSVLPILSPPDEVALLAEELDSEGLPQGKALTEDLLQFSSLINRFSEELSAKANTRLQPLYAELEAVVEKRNARYFELRKEQQDVNDSLKREDVLKQQVEHLEQLQRHLDQVQEQERSLREDRRSTRSRIQQLGDRIYQFRMQQVEQINNEHGEVVVLTLEQGARSGEYAAQLASLLHGSRLRNREELARDLAEKIRPSDLVDIVEAGESQRLADLLGRDLGQMARLLSYLMDNQDFYDVEGIVFEDRLEITMYDGQVPKPVSQLSRGQMATALLPLILRPADYPLIFDQPEDDLDNRFIYTTLVEKIQQLKRERQLIFITHNANIPVLGEADRVIVMHMDTPTKASAPEFGSVDQIKRHILTLLEGGADAFRRRQQKYGELLE
jgi:DNA repair ATPase RecN